VFTGGIGENVSAHRQAVLEGLTFLGVELDYEKNEIQGEEVELSKPGSRVRAFVIPTNEELVIARDTMRLVNS
jgi:acetate kinase